MKKVLAFLAKLLFSLIFSLVLIEVGLRLFPTLISLDFLIYFNEETRTAIARSRGLPTRTWDTVLLERDDQGPELHIYQPFTQLTWPNEDGGPEITAEMDEMGFCNPPYSYQPPVIDIITLGDSFTACHAISPAQSWTRQLASLSGKSTYNLGRIGTGLQEYLQILKQFGLQKSPHLVIMNVYQGNDFRDAAVYYQTRLAASGGISSPAIPAAASPAGSWLTENFVGRHSYALNLFAALAAYGRETYGLSPETAKIPVNFRYELVFPDGVSIAFNPDNVDKDEVRTAKQLAGLALEPEVFQAIDQALQTFVALGQAHNFTPIVTYTPSAYTTYADYVVFEDPDLQGLMPSFSYEQRQYLAAKGREFGYDFIDLTPGLQELAHASGSQKLLYYRHDLHLTPLGHQALAEVLHQALLEQGVLP
jgi:hypothetical protein